MITNLLKFLVPQNPLLAWAVLVPTILIALILLYLFARSRSAYSRGYKVGKKVAKNYKEVFLAELRKLDSASELEEKLKSIQAQVFRIGFEREVEIYQARIREIDGEISELSEKAPEVDSVNQGDLDREIATTRERILKLEEEREEIEEALRDAESAADAAQKEVRASIPRPSVEARSGVFVEKVRTSLNAAISLLSRSMPLYGYAFLAAALFLGDMYVVYDLFSDLISIQVGLPEGMAFIASGVVALVFVVLVEFAYKAIKQKQKAVLQQYMTYAAYVTGGLLFLGYMVIIILPALEGLESVMVDVLLRILFLPLIFAVCLLLEKIKEEGGGFNLIFNPLIIIVLFVTLIIGYFVHAIEKSSRKASHVNSLEEGTRKETLEERRLRTLRRTISQRITTAQEDVKRLVAQRDGLVTKEKVAIKRDYGQARRESKSFKQHLLELQRGSDEAVIAHLQLLPSKLK